MKPRTKLLPRGEYHRDARLFVIATEGQRTEPTYFRVLEANRLIPTTRVRLLVLPTEHGCSAIQHLKERVMEHLKHEHFLEDFDQVWLVLDTDLHVGGRKEQLHELANDCKASGWQLAISHPCFEVWLLLHLTEDLSAIDETCDSVQRRLRQHLGGYDKSHPPECCRDAAALERAIARAERADEDPKAPWPLRPTSWMYRMLRQLRASTF